MKSKAVRELQRKESEYEKITKNSKRVESTKRKEE